MQTELLSSEIINIQKAAKLIANGEVIGMPTETVYGLAADALNEGAVKKIFTAKGRPADNPLIVHIAELSSLDFLVHDIPEVALKLAQKFWPGPLTMVLKKNNCIPEITSGGLDTVGIRMPSHPIARELIKASGKVLAAPSANLSGSPSPTTAKHVFDDMCGKIPLIIDGGTCDVGIESTVISFENGNVRLLRPGFISVEDLLTVSEQVYTDSGILGKVDESEKVLSPGMKYKHYSPKAEVIIVNGDFEQFCKFMEIHNSEDVCAMVFDRDRDNYPYSCLTYGDTSIEQAHEIFDKLREIDTLNVKTVYVRAPSSKGVGLAVYNRLLRAAGFEVINL